MDDSPIEQDLKRVSETQKLLHFPDKIIEGLPLEAQPEFISMFHEPGFDRRTLWYNLKTIKLNAFKTTGYITYDIDKTYMFSSLAYTWVEIVLPEVKIKDNYKDKYAICWPHNIGHNIIEQGDFLVDNICFGTVTPQILDREIQYCELSGHGYRDLRQNKIGNIEPLTSFNSELPSYPLSIDIPFYYTRDSIQAYPLHKLQPDQRVRFLFKYQLNIKKLLIVKDLETGKLLDFSPINESKTMGILDGVIGDNEIPIPNLYCNFGSMRPKDTFCYYSEGYINYNTMLKFKKNCSYLDSNVEIGIDSGGAPVKCIFMMAENIDAKEKHIFSNYSVGETQMVSYSPISNITFKSGDSDNTTNDSSSDLPIEHYERMTTRYFQSAPFEPGYFAEVYSIDPCGGPNLQPGVVFNEKDKIIFNLNRKDIYDRHFDCKKFIIHVFAVVTKRYDFKKIATPQENSNSK